MALGLYSIPRLRLYRSKHVNMKLKPLTSAQIRTARIGPS